MIDIIALVIGFTQNFKIIFKKLKKKSFWKDLWEYIKSGKILFNVVAILLGTYFNMQSTEWTFWQGLEGALLGLAATMIVHLTKEQQDALKSSVEIVKDGKITPEEVKTINVLLDGIIEKVPTNVLENPLT